MLGHVRPDNATTPQYGEPPNSGTVVAGQHPCRPIKNSEQDPAERPGGQRRLGANTLVSSRRTRGGRSA